MICVGSALFTIFSSHIGGPNDPARITAQIVSGVGFLGAGVILHMGSQVKGLTTASTVWLSAALGIGAGSGYLVFTAVAALMALFVLVVMHAIEDRLEAARLMRVYHVVSSLTPGKNAELTALFQKCDLLIKSQGQSKRGDELVIHIKARGRLEDHDRVAEALIADADVRDFEYA